MILIFKDGDRYVATPNWTVSATDSQAAVSVTYRCAHVHPEHPILTSIKISFPHFLHRLETADAAGESFVDLR